MLAFPGMLLNAAEKAGMKVPPDPDNFEPLEYPHFEVFCKAQLGRRMNSLAEHWDNAKIIAGIPDDQILTVTPDDLLSMGFSWPMD